MRSKTWKSKPTHTHAHTHTRTHTHTPQPWEQLTAGEADEGQRGALVSPLGAGGGPDLGELVQEVLLLLEVSRRG